MMRLPPTPTLFPYTTLFRSGPQRDFFLGEPDELVGDGLARRPRRLARPSPTRDRKSTRLNSSHVAISYAVFCLKKKTKKLSRSHPRPRTTAHTTHVDLTN